jgi:hypothetical protein
VLTEDALRRLYAELQRLGPGTRQSGQHGASGREAMLAGALFDLGAGDLASFAFGDAAGERAGDRACDVLPAIEDDALRLAMATGAAVAGSVRNGRGVVVAFAAGELPKPVLRFAGEQQAPIVFVSELQKARANADGNGFPAIPVDLDDAVAIYRVAHESIVRARQGGGPTRIDCVPYWIEGQRAPERRDPVAAMKAYLRAKGVRQRG